MSFLDSSVHIRLSKELIDKIDLILEQDPYKYDNISHFIRCSVMELCNKNIKSESNYINKKGEMEYKGVK